MRSLIQDIIKCLKTFCGLRGKHPTEEDRMAAAEMCLRARHAGVCPNCCEKCAWGRV